MFFVWLIAYGNLLGVRESGRIFALPTYVFIMSLGLTCGIGLYRVLFGHLAAFNVAQWSAAAGCAALTLSALRVGPDLTWHNAAAASYCVGKTYPVPFQ